MNLRDTWSLKYSGNISVEYILAARGMYRVSGTPLFVMERIVIHRPVFLCFTLLQIKKTGVEQYSVGGS